MFWILFGVGLFSFTIGMLTNYIGNIENSSYNLNNKLNKLEQFATESNFSFNFKILLRDAMEYNESKTNYTWFKEKEV